MEKYIISEDVTYLFLSDHSQPILLGFAVVGLLSALMSSGDSFLNIISISQRGIFRLETQGKSKKAYTETSEPSV
jgi:hypothetical protein